MRRLEMAYGRVGCRTIRRTAPTFDGHIARWYAHEGNEIRSRSPNFVSGPFSISTSWLRMSVALFETTSCVTRPGPRYRRNSASEQGNHVTAHSSNVGR